MKRIYLPQRRGGTLLFAMLCTAIALRAQVVQTFSYTGSAQSFTVPACVANVTLEVWGAQGGANWANNDNFGGYARAVFSVTAGDVLNVYVGQQPNGITGGYNGGGNGEGAGQGGGGGTDFRLNGTALANRIIVAGGGGGAGYWSNLHVVGGQGGGLVGTDGYRMPNDPGGQGGTQSGSGTGTCISFSVAAMAGGLGYGGAPNNCGCEGYGGGGGYWGGAGSGNCRGGGGGSGYILPSATAPTFSTGVNVGNGQARISWFTNGNGVVVNSTAPMGICPGGSATLTASGVTNFTWSNGSQQPNLPVSPAVTSTYGVSGTNSLGCISNFVYTVVVNQPPQISITPSSSFVCNGQTATLNAVGASTYTWNDQQGNLPGTSGVVTVTANMNSPGYTVTGVSPAGCASTAQLLLNVNTMLLSVSGNTAICSGQQAQLSASGANAGTYLWVNNMNGLTVPFSNAIVSPTVTTVYTVTGTDVNNCVLSESLTVAVNPNPTITAMASRTVMCKGESQLLTASGASSYLWSGGETAATISISPLVNTVYTYTVSGTDANGCSGGASVSVRVELCTGMEEHGRDVQIVVYPNPGNGLFTLDAGDSHIDRVEVYSVEGKLIFHDRIDASRMQLDLPGHPSGFYYVKLRLQGGGISTARLVKNGTEVSNQ